MLKGANPLAFIAAAHSGESPTFLRASVGGHGMSELSFGREREECALAVLLGVPSSDEEEPAAAAQSSSMMGRPTSSVGEPR